MFREAMSIVSRRIGFGKSKRHAGSTAEIAKAIAKDCWNGQFFCASAGHFQQFWTRDFGISIDALLKLGFRKEVCSTLRYALSLWKKNGAITTTISNGKAWDFPTFSPDSLAFALRSLVVSQDTEVLYEYKDFLEEQIAFFEKLVIDPATGLVKRNVHFSSMKDHSIRSSSCYDNIMVAMVAKAASSLGLLCSFKFQRKEFLRTYWSGNFFFDDAKQQSYIAGDANVLPFWSGIIQNKKMARLAIASIQNEGLTTPLPLRYTAQPPSHNWIWQRAFAPNYEGTTIWTNLGMLYLDVIQNVNLQLYKEAVQHYSELMRLFGTMPEVLVSSQKPYSSIFYKCDEGMLWGVNVKKHERGLKDIK